MVDRTAYIRATIESAEQELLRDGFPQDLIDGYSAHVWEGRHVAYGTPQMRYVVDGWHMTRDAEAALGIKPTRRQSSLTALIGVARALLDVFDSLTAEEVALTKAWAELERLCFDPRIQVGERVVSGGAKGKRLRAEQDSMRHDAVRQLVREAAERLRARGVSDRELSGAVAQNIRAKFPRAPQSAKQIRTILRELEILPPKKKREMPS